MKNTISEPPGRQHLAKIARRSNVIPLLKAPLGKQSPSTQEESSLRAFSSVDDMVHQMRPELPVYCLRPTIITNMAKRFLKSFPGDVLYAVKTNPDVNVLKWLAKAGVQHFDVASLAEIKLVADNLTGVHMHFMHPVKSREAIAKAYHKYGIRDYSLDSLEELHKILEVTNYAEDLNLYVRLSVSNENAAYSLSGKFGIAVNQSAELLIATRKFANKLGVCFHVGSQCMDPEAYVNAMQSVADLLVQTNVSLDILDIGGGFPSIYPGMLPPSLGYYMKAIRKGLKLHPSFATCQIMCEPGRALVAEGGSTIARVELRKGNMLYLNEGTYGSLFDAGSPGFVFPVKAIRTKGNLSSKLAEFSFFGPTCDSLDSMKGPFHLPEDINEGDWIEIGQLGSYGKTMATNFNGFQSDTVVEVGDKPLLSMLGVN
jgi:ornithine decarboxylase